MIKHYNYRGQVIEFLIGDDIMINATEMAKVFGKEPYNFLKLESTKATIKELEKSYLRSNRSYAAEERLAKNQIIIGEIKHRSADLLPLVSVKMGGDEGGGTWLHKILAIKLATWLDTKFEIWVFTTIDELINRFGSNKIKIANRKNEIKLEKSRIMENSTSEDVIKLRILLEEENDLKGLELNLNKDFKNNLKNN